MRTTRPSCLRLFRQCLLLGFLLTIAKPSGWDLSMMEDEKVCFQK